MCGIGGIYRFGTDSIDRDHIKMLLCALESRGMDASGVALLNEREDEIHVCKDDTPGHQLAASEELADCFERHLSNTTKIALVHCRAATKGTPHKNENNHPLYAGGGAIIHNGIISNDDRMFGELHLDRKAETDSDILRAIIDKWGLTPKAVKIASRLNGSIAAACIHVRAPEHLLLLRSGGPLILAANDDFLFWASEKQALHKAARPWNKRFGIWMQDISPKLGWVGMATDSAWLIGPRGMEWHKEFKTASWNGVMGSYNSSSNYFPKSYHDQQKRWNTKSKDLKDNNNNNTQKYLPAGKRKTMFCPNTKCFSKSGVRSMIEITGIEDKLGDYICAKCQSNLLTGKLEETLVN